jgi:hypothetical protein
MTHHVEKFTRATDVIRHRDLVPALPIPEGDPCGQCDGEWHQRGDPLGREQYLALLHEPACPVALVPDSGGRTIDARAATIRRRAVTAQRIGSTAM